MSMAGTIAQRGATPCCGGLAVARAGAIPKHRSLAGAVGAAAGAGGARRVPPFSCTLRVAARPKHSTNYSTNCNAAKGQGHHHHHHPQQQPEGQAMESEQQSSEQQSPERQASFARPQRLAPSSQQQQQHEEEEECEHMDDGSNDEEEADRSSSTTTTSGAEEEADRSSSTTTTGTAAAGDCKKTTAGTDALFLVQLSTSKEPGSGLSDPSAGVMLSLIGEDGSALLQRIPPSPSSPWDAAADSAGPPRFRTGSRDLVTLHGSNLGKLEALWVAPESGTWRLERVVVAEVPCTPDNLKTIAQVEAALMTRAGTATAGAEAEVPVAAAASSLLDDAAAAAAAVGKETPLALTGLAHLFRDAGAADLLVGDKCDLSAVELTPCAVHPFHDVAGLKAHFVTEERLAGVGKEDARESGMSEYRALKATMLRTSGAVVALGTVAALAGLRSQQVAEGFAVGGITGFFYLLLLQYAVDLIPGPGGHLYAAEEEEEEEEEVGAGDGKGAKDGKGAREGKDRRRRRRLAVVGAQLRKLVLAPLPRSAVVAAVALLLSRSVLGKAVSPQEFVAGVAGFLVTVKVTLFLAPASDKKKDKKE